MSENGCCPTLFCRNAFSIAQAELLGLTYIASCRASTTPETCSPPIPTPFRQSAKIRNGRLLKNKQPEVKVTVINRKCGLLTGQSPFSWWTRRPWKWRRQPPRERSRSSRVWRTSSCTYRKCIPKQERQLSWLHLWFQTAGRRRLAINRIFSKPRDEEKVPLDLFFRTICKKLFYH